MSNVTPIATRLGFTHVSVAQISSGEWHAVLWSDEGGPTALPSDGEYRSAISQAIHYADKNPNAVLDLPSDDNFRTVDVLRSDSGAIDVWEWSCGYNSGSVLRSFGLHQREEALAFALRQIPNFAPCKLGRVEI